MAPVYASQSISLAPTKESNKIATVALLEVVQRKETTPDGVITLIDKGADVNAKDQYSGTPLIWAACNGLADVCITLIDKGADVNAIDNRGRSPLSLAATKSLRDLCILLLRHLLLKQLLGADPDGGDLSTRKLRMLCVILALKKTTINKDLIPLILKSKPLIHDYIACRYDTYCCRPVLHEYPHSITRDQLCNLLGQDNIDALKAAMQQACNACGGNNPALKNLLNPVAFDQHFDELFLKYIPPLKSTIGE